MANKRFLIAPLKFGEQRNVRPWMIPDDAFSQLENAYVWRGRLLKRHGAQLMGDGTQIQSRLRLAVGTTDGAGNLGATVVPGTLPLSQFGQAFSVGTQMFYVYQNGAMHPGIGLGTGTFNIATGTVTIAGATALTTVYYYPAHPVMGIDTLEDNSITNELTIAFDTEFAYQYQTSGWERLGLGAGAAIWTGGNADFFWGTSYRGSFVSETFFFVTNYTVADNIKYWNPGAGTWTTFVPAIVAAPGTDTLLTAKILVPFQNRLLALNTIENTSGIPTTYSNRLRFSKYGNPIDTDSWITNPGLGGFLDCPFQQEIVAAEFVKNRLIVYCEESTWEIVYINNQISPFAWQLINNEFGAESTFSVVPFDKVILAVGETGINACNGANVERIDEIIPDTVFNIRNSQDGLIRVHGIRDYFSEQVLWTYATQEHQLTFPNQLIVFDYKQGTWAFFDDSITTFGYYRNQTGNQWQNLPVQWNNYNTPWNSGYVQELFRNVVCGNQEGWTFLLSQFTSKNSQSLQISDITFSAGNPSTFVVYDHNLDASSNVFLEGMTGSASIAAANDTIYTPLVIDKDTFQLASWNASSQGYDPLELTGPYNGGGTGTLVSQIDILSKTFNFFAEVARNSYIAKIDFLVGRTTSGKISVVFNLDNSTNFFPSLFDPAQLGGGVLETYPYPNTQEATMLPDFLWHTVYFQADGNYIQFNLLYNNDQWFDPDTAFAPFDLEAMLIHAQPTGRLQ